LREGEWSYFHPSGVLAACGVWRAGERCGAWSFFDDAGRLLECGEYLAGERSGAWEVYERAVAPPDDPLDERQ
jgi:antitoxin component YwqK of YwqJK toxin-antitoxin module